MLSKTPVLGFPGIKSVEVLPLNIIHGKSVYQKSGHGGSISVMTDSANWQKFPTYKNHITVYCSWGFQPQLIKDTWQGPGEAWRAEIAGMWTLCSHLSHVSPVFIDPNSPKLEGLT